MRHLRTLAVPCGLLGLLVFAGPVHAAGIHRGDPALGPGRSLSPLPAAMVFFGWGDQLFETGPLPGDWHQNPQVVKKFSGAKAGYRCKVFSLFWAVIHKWECEAVAFNDETDTVLRIDNESLDKALHEAIRKTYELSDIKLTLWQRWGRFVIGGVLLLFIIGSVVRRRRS